MVYFARCPQTVDTQNPHTQSVTLNRVMDIKTQITLRHPIKVTQGNLNRQTIITPGEDMIKDSSKYLALDKLHYG